jgi:sigma-B regulation protein RsbU (phosphoserine phosphatase)
LANISGPPLGTYAGLPYQRGSAKLSPGDSLHLTTDGVTEASNGEEWFGSVRLESWLKHVNPAADVREWVESLRLEVRNFEAGYPPMDDLTLLALQWRGPEGTPRISESSRRNLMGSASPKETLHKAVLPESSVEGHSL